MSLYDFEDERFYKSAMRIYEIAGHVFTSSPEFANHSAQQFVYLDCKQDFSISTRQRELLKSFTNVSRLFTVNNCAFFSIVLLASHKTRSQLAHDIHTMIHPGTGEKGTICMFKYDDEIMLSFVGYGYKCVLSDWYPFDDDYDTLLNKLDIANVSIDKDSEYFGDLIYLLARDYYSLPKNPSIYELIPYHLFTETLEEDFDRDELGQILEEELTRPLREYGDDYVEYDDLVLVKKDNIFADLDLLLLELDTEDEEEDEDSLFSDDIDEEDDDLDDESTHENVDRELDGIDPEAFKDPELLVKWIRKHS